MNYLFVFVFCITFLFGNTIKYIDSPVIYLNTKNLTEILFENNREIKKLRLELKNLYLDEMKNESKFDWNLIVNSQFYSLHLPENDSNLLSGNKNSRNSYSVALRKNFITETLLELELKRIRTDSNSLETPRTKNKLRDLNASPVTFTDSLRVMLSQEFLQSNFGKSEKKNIRILMINQKINEKQIFEKISKILSDTMIDFWNLKITQLDIKTAKKKLENTNQIYQISLKNTKKGLYKKYQPYLWQGELLNIKNEILRLTLKKNAQVRKIRQILNINPKISLLFENPKIRIKKMEDFQTAYKYAFQNRAETYVLRKKKEILKNQIQIAKFKNRPSLSLKIQYSPVEISNDSDFSKFWAVNNHLLSSRNTENKAFINFSHTLDKRYDEVKDLKVNYKKLLVEEKDIKIKIRNEILHLRNQINYYKRAINKQKKIKSENQIYYRKFFREFQLGKENQTDLKLTLDTLIDSIRQLNVTQINYEISILKYQLAKNSLEKKIKLIKDFKE